MSYIEVYFNGILQRTAELKDGVATIGRMPDNTVCLDNQGVSSHHAIITKKENRYYIEDINSTNGTYLNGQRLSSKQPLSFDDSIKICKHTLKFVNTPSTTATISNNVGAYDMDDADNTIMLSAIKRPATKPNSEAAVHDDTATAYLLVHGELRGIKKLLLNNPHYSIGKAKYNDLRVGGWFTAKKIAEINLIGDNYYLTALKPSKVKVNGMPITSKIRLSNDDSIKIKKLTLKFLREQ